MSAYLYENHPGWESKTVNGIHGKVIKLKADKTGSHAGLPTYANTSDMYFRVGKDGKVIQAKVYISRKMWSPSMRLQRRLASAHSLAAATWSVCSPTKEQGAVSILYAKTSRLRPYWLDYNWTRSLHKRRTRAEYQRAYTSAPVWVNLYVALDMRRK